MTHSILVFFITGITLSGHFKWHTYQAKYPKFQKRKKAHRKEQRSTAEELT